MKIWLQFAFEFELDLLHRIGIAALMPNLLVWGFMEVGIADNRNPIWNSFLGPYWHFEVFLFYLVKYALLIGASVFLLACFGCLVMVTSEFIQKLRVERHRDREAAEFEADRQRVGREHQEALARERAWFEALPESDREKISRDREAREAARALERKREYEKFEQARLAEIAQAEANEQERAAIANSAENKRERAIRDFTGGRR